MSLNQRFLSKLAESLFSDLPDKELFLDSLQKGQSAKQALCWLASESTNAKVDSLILSPFFDFIYFTGSEVSGSHSAHQDGSFYLLDASSAFAVSILKAVQGKVDRILDVCAAPGGKAIVAWKYFQPKFILANETINKRVKILISNLSRCNIRPSAVAALDSKLLSAKYPGMFDLVLVDAPCSGQSLIARGEDSPGALNPVTINTNSNRQKRILANAANTVRAGGYLAYMTCTFSKEENEEVVKWFLKKFPTFKTIEVTELSEYQSKYCDFSAYRLFPHQGLGAGAFAVLLKSQDTDSIIEVDFSDQKFAWQHE